MVGLDREDAAGHGEVVLVANGRRDAEIGVDADVFDDKGAKDKTALVAKRVKFAVRAAPEAVPSAANALVKSIVGRATAAPPRVLRKNRTWLYPSSANARAFSK